MRLSIVATLYQSDSHLPEFVARVMRVATSLTTDFEIVLVNDGSPDRSLEVALGLQAEHGRVRIVDLSRNFGHHRAIMTGLAHARGDLIFLIDADLEEAPELLPEFMARLRHTGADVVYGQQGRRRGGWVEQAGGWLFFKVFNALSTFEVPVNVVTVRLMTRRYVDALVRHQEREMMIAGLWAATGFHQESVTIEKPRRGPTTYRFGRKLALLVNSVTSFSDRPLVAIFYLGLAIVTLATMAALALIVRRLFFGALLQGWASLIVSVWLLGGLTIFCLGIIGMYLSKVFLETKQRPYTVVRHIYEPSETDVTIRRD